MEEAREIKVQLEIQRDAFRGDTPLGLSFSESETNDKQSGILRIRSREEKKHWGSAVAAAMCTSSMIPIHWRIALAADLRYLKVDAQFRY